MATFHAIAVVVLAAAAPCMPKAGISVEFSAMLPAELRNPELERPTARVERPATIAVAIN